MSYSANLALPFLEAGQAQKHVTHNEALRLLDTLVQLAVLARGVDEPPASPAEGERWIVGAAPTGAFSGHADEIAAWQDGAWQFSAPRTGWLAYVVDESKLVAWDGAEWIDALAVFHNLPMLGINTTADATNRLAVKSDAVLLSHDDQTPGTGNVHAKLNKAAAANDAAAVFQNGFSTRALLGLLADDHFMCKVSADGSTFRKAFCAFNDSGRLDLRRSARERRMEWRPRPDSTTIDALGLGFATSGTLTAVTPAAGDYTQWPRVQLLTAASTFSIAEIHGASQCVWRGNAAGRGGFYFHARFGIATHVTNTRLFVGLHASTAASPSGNPLTLTEMVGVAFQSAQTTLRIARNDGAGSASSTDLGANFPANTSGVDVYDLMLWCEPNGSEIGWRVHRLNSGHVASGVFTSDLPGAGTFLAPHVWISNGNTASASAIDLVHMYLEALTP
jgi:hypothetical protein